MGISRPIGNVSGLSASPKTTKSACLVWPNGTQAGQLQGRGSLGLHLKCIWALKTNIPQWSRWELAPPGDPELAISIGTGMRSRRKLHLPHRGIWGRVLWSRWQGGDGALAIDREVSIPRAPAGRWMAHPTWVHRIRGASCLAPRTPMQSRPARVPTCF